MFIVLILLLTVLDIAMKLASRAIIVHNQIKRRQERLEKEDDPLGRVEDTLKRGVSTASAYIMRLLSKVVSTFRNILIIIAPVICIVMMLFYLVALVTSSVFTTLYATVGDDGKVSMGSSNGTVSSSEGTQTSDETTVSNGRSKVLLIGDSRTVGLATYVLGMSSSDGSVIGETDDGDYIFAKTSMGLSWMKSNEEAIDSLVSDDMAIVINMGTNDALSTTSAASLYVEWLNKKAEDWTSKGATVWFMNTGPVDDNGYSSLKNRHVVKFNDAVKSGLSDKIGYIDEYSALINYGSVIYDDFGVHYDKKSYEIVWDLVNSTVRTQS